jgi:predicted nucleic acid-binding protein
MFLIDTNVLSELRRQRPNVSVVSWVKQQDERQLFISVLSIGEIERGARLQQAINPIFAQQLSQWLLDTERLFFARTLDITPAIARCWGKLSADLGNTSIDLLIAATARIHNLTVVTRNTKHFEPTGVNSLNPFEV